MSGLPQKWEKVAISELAAFNPKTIAEDSLQCAFASMHYLGTRFRSRMDFEERTWGDIKKSYVHFQTNDVIVAKVTPCFENGKAGIVPVIPNGIGAGSSEFCVFRPIQGIDARYLLAWLSTEDFRRRATVAMTGSVGLKRVPKDVFLDEQIPLAPKEEQRRIADKLDTVLTRVDAVQDRLTHITPLLKRFRQSILAAATSGRLTEEWRNEQKVQKGKLGLLGELGEVLAGQSPSVSEVNYEGCGTPYVTGPEQWDGKKILAHKWTEFPKRIAPEGSIFITVKGAGVGKTFPGCYAAIGRDVYAFVVNAKNEINYVLFAIQASTEKVIINAKGLIPGLTKKDISEHQIYIPNLPEQTEIVRRVDLLMGYADRLEARLQAAQTAAERLTPALLAKAFRGELVPQDPSDEPAAELLRRLREARAAQAPAKPKRGRKATVTKEAA